MQLGWLEEPEVLRRQESSPEAGRLPSGNENRSSVPKKTPQKRHYNVNHPLTLTSNNPNVTFPPGKVVAFPPIQKSDENAGFIRVAVDGAAELRAWISPP